MRAHSPLVTAAASVVALILAAGCGTGTADSELAENPVVTSSPAPEAFDITVDWEEPSTAPGGGVVGRFADVQNIGVEEFSRIILENGAVDGIAERFSSEFVIPEPLAIHVVRGDVSPNYDPRTKTLTLSYGFATLTGNIIAEAQPNLSEEAFGAAWAAVNDFVLVHEIAHAFVDVLRKPDGQRAILVTGREEDTADGMATYFFTDAVQGGAQYAFEAAKFFAALQGFQGVPDATAYADEHSLSIQRAVDIACKVAGSSQGAFNYIASLGTTVMPESRLRRCPAEYEQLSSTWEALLDPVRKSETGDESSPSPSS